MLVARALEGRGMGGELLNGFRVLQDEKGMVTHVDLILWNCTLKSG